MRFKEIKAGFRSFIKDERGITISPEALIFLVGSALVASVVIGAITVILTGKDKDGAGGVTGNVTKQIDNIMTNMTEGK